MAIVKPLSIAAFSSLSVSYFAASAAGRHPYLLYSAFSIPISFAFAYFQGLPVYNSLANLLASQSVADSSNENVSTKQKKDLKESKEPKDSKDSDFDSDFDVVSKPRDDSSKQNLESSVYNITNSDLDLEEGNNVSEPKEADKSISAGSAFSKTDNDGDGKTNTMNSNNEKLDSYENLVSFHVGKLVKYGQIISGITGTAFLIATVGIYGDLN